MNIWQGDIYHDDRLFILDLQLATKSGNRIWVVTTRRNIKGFPPRRVDEFNTKEEAIDYLKLIEPTTPRISLQGKSPSPELTYDEHIAWCEAEGIPDSLQIHTMNNEHKRKRELLIQELTPDEIAEQSPAPY